MVGLTLLHEARRAGLRVRTEGGRLIVRGPRSQEALARRLLEHKAEVLAALEAEQTPPVTEPTDFDRADAFFQEHGWVPIRSRTLGGEVVVFLRDEQVAVPEQWRDAVSYTLEDLAALEGVSPDGLRLTHETKRIFGGRVLRGGDARAAAAKNFQGRFGRTQPPYQQAAPALPGTSGGPSFSREGRAREGGRKLVASGNLV